MSTYTTVLYRIRNVFKTYSSRTQRIQTYLLNFHTSAYVGAIRRSLTGPLREFQKKKKKHIRRHITTEASDQVMSSSERLKWETPFNMYGLT